MINNKLWLSILIFLSVLHSMPIWANQTPSSARSHAAITAVTPQLKQLFVQKKLKYGSPIFIRGFKEDKILEIWVKNNTEFVLFKQYKICNDGGMGLGPKLQEGDGFAPEGFYKVYPQSLNPNSILYLSFNLGYPNEYDRAHQRTGSALMIHGECVSIGCYAMTNPVIEEIYTLVNAAFTHGQPFIQVHLFPFELTQKNINYYSKNKNINFWLNLKTGYDYFENNHQLPKISVRNKTYIFQ